MGKGRVGEGEGAGKGTKQACRGAYPIYATPTTMTGRQTAGGRAFACHHFTTRCRRKGVRQRQLSQLCPAMHSVSSASPLPLDSYLPPFPYVAYNHCQRYSFIHSCTTSRLHHLQLHPPFSQLDALFVLDARCSLDACFGGLLLPRLCLHIYIYTSQASFLCHV